MCRHSLDVSGHPLLTGRPLVTAKQKVPTKQRNISLFTKRNIKSRRVTSLRFAALITTVRHANRKS